MDKELIIKDSGINPKNCMSKSKTQLQDLAKSLDITYTSKNTKEQLCFLIFENKFSCPKKGSNDDVNNLEPSGIPSEDIHILDALYNRCNFFTLDRLKELAKMYGVQYSGTRKMLCNRIIGHITNRSDNIDKEKYKVETEPFKPYKCNPSNIRYTKNDLKELAKKYNVEYSDDKKDVCKKLFEVQNKIIKQSYNKSPGTREKVKKTISTDIKNIKNLQKYYHDRLNELAEKISENLSLDELMKLQDEFSNLTELCSEHLPNARILREIIKEK